MTDDIRRGVYHPDHRQKGPGGKYHCKRCGREVPKGPKRYWCSDACVAAWKDEHDPHHQRNVVWKRDHGICQRCGMSVALLKRIIVRLGWFRMRYSIYSTPLVDFLLGLLGFNAHNSLWEADHRIPLCEGGEPGTVNMRVLCVPCHRIVTNELKARLAERRRSG